MRDCFFRLLCIDGCVFFRLLLFSLVCITSKPSDVIGQFQIIFVQTDFVLCITYNFATSLDMYRHHHQHVQCKFSKIKDVHIKR